MDFKRITILSGHYGSGKTNIAVNLAFDLRKQCENVAIADVDIVNPYFRTKDSEAELHQAGIRLICSQYANSNVDLPALPQDLYAITDDRTMHCILDVGGDERGALALGRIAPAIREENDYDMLFVINCYRPLTRDAASTMEVMHEIEAACGLRFSAIVNNSNLGRDTAPEDVLSSMPYAREISELAGIPILFTAVDEALFEPLRTHIDKLYSISLQKKL